MWVYVLKRSAGGMFVFLLATLLTFAFLRVAPGDLALLMLAGPEGSVAVDPAQVEALRRELGLDRPLIVQYADFITGLARGDWGKSFWTGRPLVDELRARIPVTVEIALLSEAVAWFIAVPMGLISALRRGTLPDALARLIVIVGLAVPNFWFGILVLIFMLRVFGWVPPLGMRSLADDPIAHLQQIALPVFVLGYTLSASLCRLIRGDVLDVLNEPYVTVARAKGLGSFHVIWAHVLRNALFPALTYSTLRIAGLLGGVVVIETVFNIPGLGRFFVDAVLHRDYPAVQVIVAIMAWIYVIINVITDLAYLYLDPRVRA